jgi:hypothetical protein
LTVETATIPTRAAVVHAHLMQRKPRLLVFLGLALISNGKFRTRIAG